MAMENNHKQTIGETEELLLRLMGGKTNGAAIKKVCILLFKKYLVKFIIVGLFVCCRELFLKQFSSSSS